MREAEPVKYRITQYNTHLFGETSLDRFPANLVTNIIHNDTHRLESIIAKLAALDSDIIVLCEVWAAETIRIITEHFGQRGYYAHHHNDPGFLFGSGLVVLSKYTLTDVSFTGYKDLYGADRFSSKGFLDVKIALHAKKILHLLHTHVQSWWDSHQVKMRAKNFQQLFERVAAIRAEDVNAHIMVSGDLNMVGDQAEYRQINRQFEKFGLFDCFRKKFSSDVDYPGYTYDAVNNKLIHQFDKVSTRKKIQYRLDYFYTNTGEVEEFVIPRFTQGGGEDVSDHHPIVMSLRTN
jgi:endonuclease/exonuclease/phosphatase family metal-dependent hydrolase